MNKVKRFIIGATASAVMLGMAILGFTAFQVQAQETGDTVEFIVPAGTDIPIGGDKDKIIYVAQPSGSTEAGTCATNTDVHPSQTVVIVNPGGDTDSQESGIITLTLNGNSQTAAIPNGTKLWDVREKSTCAIGTANYEKYKATVE